MKSLTTTALRLRALRKSKGMSQNDIADYLGISRTAYNKYEAGVIQPVRKVKELAMLFHVSTDYILGYDESPLQPLLRKADIHTKLQVKKYLQLSPGDRTIVNSTLDAIYRQRAK